MKQLPMLPLSFEALKNRLNNSIFHKPFTVSSVPFSDMISRVAFQPEVNQSFRTGVFGRT